MKFKSLATKLTTCFRKKKPKEPDMEDTLSMGSEDGVLKSGVMITGAKFEVSADSTDGTYGPGTTGFMAFVKGKDKDFSNVFFKRVVITRRGKSGKSRVNIVDLSCPVFDFGAGNKLARKIMPEEKRKYYIHVEPVALQGTLLEIDSLDFIAWAASQVQFLNKLSGNASHFTPWPSASKHVLNKLFHITDYWDEDPKYCVAEFASEPSRINIINQVRLMESSLVRCSLSYLSRVAEVEYLAAKGLLEHWSSDFKLTTKTSLRETTKSFERKWTALNSLASKKPAKA